jgi:hypothetical protein
MGIEEMWGFVSLIPLKRLINLKLFILFIYLWFEINLIVGFGCRYLLL